MRAVLDSISVAIAPNPILTSPLKMTSAQQIVKDLIKPLGVTPDIVCEVIASPTTDDLVFLTFHLYCDKQAQLWYLAPRGWGTLGQRELDLVASAGQCRVPHAAAFRPRVASASFRTRPEKTLKKIPHRSLVWVMREGLFKGAKGIRVFDRRRFEACGRLAFPHLNTLCGTETFTKLYAVATKVELSPVHAPNDFFKVESDFNTDLGLLYLKTEAHGEEHAFCLSSSRTAR